MPTNNSNKLRIILGTVNFGLDYGINNPNGRLGHSEVKKILKIAYKNGVDTLDSASSYGDSEKVIGRYLESSPNRFKIISKFCSTEIEKELALSLKKLTIARLEGYLFHRFEEYQQDKSLFDRLVALKKQKLIKKVGFSLYFPRELEEIFAKNLKIDLIQIPYSVFDQRFAPLLQEAKKRKIEVHVRSVFLQGLVFMNPNSLSRSLAAIKPNLTRLNKISESSGIRVSALALAFAYLNENIDKLVIGVDSVDYLKQNISDLAQENLAKAKKFYPALERLTVKDEQIILPLNWK